MDEPTRQRIARAFGRIPSGCSIVTARTARGRMGMLASWVQQAAFEPPMISIAIKKGRPIEALIDESSAFVLNLLGADPIAMFKHFGAGFAPGEDAFAGLATEDVPAGVLIEDRIGWLACRVHAKHDAGDHWLYLATVTDADADADAAPYVHTRRNGLSY